MVAQLDLERALVIGVASSALFDLEESDAVFREQGEERYREYQREHLDDMLEPGVAFPFIRRLLDLNDLSDRERLVEVVILSRNDPETGMRVMRSVERHGLDITRAFKTSLDVRGSFYAAPATRAMRFRLKARLKIG